MVRWPLYFLLPPFIALLPVFAKAQTFLYAGNGHYFDTPVLRIEADRCMPPYSYNLNDAFYTVTDNVITQGASRSEFDIVFTLRENKVYAGTAMYTSEIRYTFENGLIFQGNSTFRLDALFNVKDRVIYKGADPFPGDAIYMIDGPYTAAHLFAALLSLGLIR